MEVTSLLNFCYKAQKLEEEHLLAHHQSLKTPTQHSHTHKSLYIADFITRYSTTLSSS